MRARRLPEPLPRCSSGPEEAVRRRQAARRAAGAAPRKQPSVSLDASSIKRSADQKAPDYCQTNATQIKERRLSTRHSLR